MNETKNTSHVDGNPPVSVAGEDIVSGDRNVVHSQAKAITTGNNSPINIFEAGYTPPLPYGAAPPPPKLLVGREGDIAELERRLLTGKHGTTAITAVRGWPGIGKTSLVAAMAHDEKLKAAFPDGILWTALGPQPSVEAELGHWLLSFGLNPREFPTQKSRSERLGAILRDRKMLLIVDDVWDVAHAQPFLVGGQNCAMLITTREPEIAQGLGIGSEAIYKLLVLTEEASLKLLQTIAPLVVQNDPEGSRKLVIELEGLPLALHVAGRMLAEEFDMGWGISDLLAELAEGTKLLEQKAPADRTLADQTTPTIAALLENSTNRLDDAVRERFALLGVFVPKPATFNLGAILAAWGIEEEEKAKPVIRTLFRRGLIEPAPGDRFQMHALLVVHAKSMWENS